VFSGLFHRMILGELLKVFLLSVTALTGLLLLAGIFQEASKNGLSPAQILAIIPLLIPSMLPYTLPATTLFATCVVYGRLAHDNEILAIKAAGINVLRVVWPGVLLGMVVSFATVYLYYRPIPRTHFLLRVKFLKDVEEFLYGMLKREGQIVHPKLNLEIYVKQIQGRRLMDAQFMRRSPDGKKGYDMIARAREAILTVNLAQHQINIDMYDCHIISDKDDAGFFRHKIWPVELPVEFSNPGKTRSNDMTWQEMIRERVKLGEEREKIKLDIAAHLAPLAIGTAPTNFKKHVEDQTNARNRKAQEIRDIDVEMHMRPALAMGCVCFVLIGCPVGIWFSRSDYLSAFITCFLPIVMIYYPLMLCGINMGRTGRVDPGLCIWAADALLAVAALPLFRRLLKN
jgi:lipopolysaccharide export system permease protein